jgi:hypothetical protein
MRFLNTTVTAAVAVILISGCSGSTSPGAPGPLPQLSGRSQAVSPLTAIDTYVADESKNEITAYDHTGKWVCTIGGTSSKLNAPDFVTFDSSGTLYVANLKGNSVTEYGPCESSPTATLSSKNLSSPTAIAIGSGGGIYIANEGNSSVTEYQGGTVVQQLVENINKPRALVFDGDGNLYVANSGNTTTPNGWVTVCPHGTSCKTTIKTNVDNPRALAVDASNNLYVADDVSSPNGGVSEYQSYAKGNGYSTTYGLGALDSPNAMAWDSGHLCVSSNGNNEIVCYTSIGTVYGILTSSDGIDDPQSLAVGPESGWLKVANASGYTKNRGAFTQYCPKLKNCKIATTTKIDDPVSLAVQP